MKTTNNNSIKKGFAEHIYKITVARMTIILIIGFAILSSYAYSDLVIRNSIPGFYTRIIPIILDITLLIFHLFTKNKYLFAKTKIFNIFLASIIVMMYAKCLIHLNDGLLPSVVPGTILVIFLVSLEIKTNTLNTAIVFFIPFVFFIASLIFFFEISKEQHIMLANIYPIVIIGFTINRFQNKLRFNAFKSNYLLEKEKQKTDELYQETLSINENLHIKNKAIITQKNKIETQHKEITSSINYAKHIQRAMLPVNEIFNHNFQNYFIIYKPRDIVSGDFYWAEKFDDKIIYAVADCTGHGVPGAMVSMLGISLLNKITTQDMNLTTSEILEELRKEVKKSFKQTKYDGYKANDGMDIALCIIDINTKKMQYSGAYNSIYIHRKGKLIELKADKQPIGMHIREKNFTKQDLQLQKDDILYSFSDGFVDQFNPKGEKYKIINFRKLLTKIAENNLQEQKQIIENEFNNWKQDRPQIDDVVIIGIKI